MDSYLEIYDPVTGKRKKRKLTPDQSDIQRNIQQIAPNPTRDQFYDTRPTQMGKPRVQGFNGVNQGAMGFLASIANANRNRMNKAFNIALQDKNYEMPELPNKSPLSNEWFNTALKRIQVRNRMKLDLARQQAAAQVLSSLLQNQSSTTRSGVSYLNNLLSNKTREKEIAEQRRWHDTMAPYYDAMTQATLNKAQGTQAIDPLKEQKVRNERLKVFVKSPSTIIPEWDDLDEGTRREALNYYLKTGQAPTIKKIDGGWFGSDKYTIVSPNETATQSQQQQEQQAPTIGGMKILDQKITNDGRRYIKLEDGHWYEY